MYYQRRFLCWVHVIGGTRGSKAATGHWSSNWPFSCFSDSPMRNDWLIQYTHVVSPELFNGDLGLQEVIVEDDDLPAQRSFLVLMVLGLKE